MLKQVHAATHPGARLESADYRPRRVQNNSDQQVETEILQNLNEPQSGAVD